MAEVNPPNSPLTPQDTAALAALLKQQADKKQVVEFGTSKGKGIGFTGTQAEIDALKAAFTRQGINFSDAGATGTNTYVLRIKTNDINEVNALLPPNTPRRQITISVAPAVVPVPPAPAVNQNQAPLPEWLQGDPAPAAAAPVPAAKALTPEEIANSAWDMLDDNVGKKKYLGPDALKMIKETGILENAPQTLKNKVAESEAFYAKLAGAQDVKALQGLMNAVDAGVMKAEFRTAPASNKNQAPAPEWALGGPANDPAAIAAPPPANLRTAREQMDLQRQQAGAKVTRQDMMDVLGPNIHIAEDEIPKSLTGKLREDFIAMAKGKVVDAAMQTHPAQAEYIYLRALQGNLDLHVTLHNDVQHLENNRPFDPARRGAKQDDSTKTKGAANGKRVWLSLDVVNDDGELKVSSAEPDFLKKIAAKVDPEMVRNVGHETTHLFDVAQGPEKQYSMQEKYKEARTQDRLQVGVMEDLQQILAERVAKLAPGEKLTLTADDRQKFLKAYLKRSAEFDTRVEDFNAMQGTGPIPERVVRMEDGKTFLATDASPLTSKDYLEKLFKDHPELEKMRQKVGATNDPVADYVKVLEYQYDKVGGAKSPQEFVDLLGKHIESVRDNVAEIGTSDGKKSSYNRDKSSVESLARYTDAEDHRLNPKGRRFGAGINPIAQLLLPHMTDVVFNDIMPDLEKRNAVMREKLTQEPAKALTGMQETAARIGRGFGPDVQVELAFRQTSSINGVQPNHLTFTFRADTPEQAANAGATLKTVLEREMGGAFKGAEVKTSKGKDGRYAVFIDNIPPATFNQLLGQAQNNLKDVLVEQHKEGAVFTRKENGRPDKVLVAVDLGKVGDPDRDLKLSRFMILDGQLDAMGMPAKVVGDPARKTVGAETLNTKEGVVYLEIDAQQAQKALQLLPPEQQIALPGSYEQAQKRVAQPAAVGVAASAQPEPVQAAPAQPAPVRPAAPATPAPENKAAPAPAAPDPAVLLQKAQSDLSTNLGAMSKFNRGTVSEDGQSYIASGFRNSKAFEGMLAAAGLGEGDYRVEPQPDGTIRVVIPVEKLPFVDPEITKPLPAAIPEPVQPPPAAPEQNKPAAPAPEANAAPAAIPLTPAEITKGTPFFKTPDGDLIFINAKEPASVLQVQNALKALGIESELSLNAQTQQPAGLKIKSDVVKTNPQVAQALGDLAAIPTNPVEAVAAATRRMNPEKPVQPVNGMNQRLPEGLQKLIDMARAKAGVAQAIPAEIPVPTANTVKEPPPLPPPPKKEPPPLPPPEPPKPFKTVRDQVNDAGGAAITKYREFVAREFGPAELANFDRQIGDPREYFARVSRGLQAVQAAQIAEAIFHDATSTNLNKENLKLLPEKSRYQFMFANMDMDGDFYNKVVTYNAGAGKKEDILDRAKDYWKENPPQLIGSIDFDADKRLHQALALREVDGKPVIQIVMSDQASAEAMAASLRQDKKLGATVQQSEAQGNRFVVQMSVEDATRGGLLPNHPLRKATYGIPETATGVLDLNPPVEAVPLDVQKGNVAQRRPGYTAPEVGAPPGDNRVANTTGFSLSDFGATPEEQGKTINAIHEQEFKTNGRDFYHDARELVADPAQKVVAHTREEKLRLMVAEIDKMAAKAGIPAPEIRLTDVGGTSAGYKRIYIDVHSLDALSPEALKFLAAHEVAHVAGDDILKHNGAPTKAQSHDMETKATVRATELLGEHQSAIRYFVERGREGINRYSNLPEDFKAAVQRLGQDTDVHRSLKEDIHMLRKMDIEARRAKAASATGIPVSPENLMTAAEAVDVQKIGANLKPVEVTGPGKLIKVTDGKKEYYLKVVKPDEAEMTLRASKATPGKNAITQIAQAQEMPVGSLPKELAGQLNIAEGSKVLLVEAVPNKTGLWQLQDPFNPKGVNASVADALGGKPITIAEQAQLLQEWETLKKTGVVHGDLGSNVGFERDANGSLKMHVWDFEPNAVAPVGDPKNQDIAHLQEGFEKMQQSGAAQTLDEAHREAVKDLPPEARKQIMGPAQLEQVLNAQKKGTPIPPALQEKVNATLLLRSAMQAGDTPTVDTLLGKTPPAPAPEVPAAPAQPEAPGSKPRLTDRQVKNIPIASVYAAPAVNFESQVNITGISVKYQLPGTVTGEKLQQMVQAHPYQEAIHAEDRAASRALWHLLKTEEGQKRLVELGMSPEEIQAHLKLGHDSAVTVFPEEHIMHKLVYEENTPYKLEKPFAAEEIETRRQRFLQWGEGQWQKLAELNPELKKVKIDFTNHDQVLHALHGVASGFNPSDIDAYINQRPRDPAVQALMEKYKIPEPPWVPSDETAMQILKKLHPEIEVTPEYKATMEKLAKPKPLAEPSAAPKAVPPPLPNQALPHGEEPKIKGGWLAQEIHLDHNKQYSPEYTKKVEEHNKAVGKANQRAGLFLAGKGVLDSGRGVNHVLDQYKTGEIGGGDALAHGGLASAHFLMSSTRFVYDARGMLNPALTSGEGAAALKYGRTGHKLGAGAAALGIASGGYEIYQLNKSGKAETSDYVMPVVNVAISTADVGANLASLSSRTWLQGAGATVSKVLVPVGIAMEVYNVYANSKALSDEWDRGQQMRKSVDADIRDSYRATLSDRYMPIDGAAPAFNEYKALNQVFGGVKRELSPEEMRRYLTDRIRSAESLIDDVSKTSDSNIFAAHAAAVFLQGDEIDEGIKRAEGNEDALGKFKIQLAIDKAALRELNGDFNVEMRRSYEMAGIPVKGFAERHEAAKKLAAQDPERAEKLKAMRANFARINSFGRGDTSEDMQKKRGAIVAEILMEELTREKETIEKLRSNPAALKKYFEDNAQFLYDHGLDNHPARSLGGMSTSEAEFNARAMSAASGLFDKDIDKALAAAKQTGVKLNETSDRTKGVSERIIAAAEKRRGTPIPAMEMAVVDGKGIISDYAAMHDQKVKARDEAKKALADRREQRQTNQENAANAVKDAEAKIALTMESIEAVGANTREGTFYKNRLFGEKAALKEAQAMKARSDKDAVHFDAQVKLAEIALLEAEQQIVMLESANQDRRVAQAVAGMAEQEGKLTKELEALRMEEAAQQERLETAPPLPDNNPLNKQLADAQKSLDDLETEEFIHSVSNAKRADDLKAPLQAAEGALALERDNLFEDQVRIGAMNMNLSDPPKTPEQRQAFLQQVEQTLKEKSSRTYEEQQTFLAELQTSMGTPAPATDEEKKTLKGKVDSATQKLQGDMATYRTHAAVHSENVSAFQTQSALNEMDEKAASLERMAREREVQRLKLAVNNARLGEKAAEPEKPAPEKPKENPAIDTKQLTEELLQVAQVEAKARGFADAAGAVAPNDRDMVLRSMLEGAGYKPGADATAADFVATMAKSPKGAEMLQEMATDLEEKTFLKAGPPAFLTHMETQYPKSNRYLNTETETRREAEKAYQEAVTRRDLLKSFVKAEAEVQKAAQALDALKAPTAEHIHDFMKGNYAGPFEKIQQAQAVLEKAQAANNALKEANPNARLTERAELRTQKKIEEAKNRLYDLITNPQYRYLATGDPSKIFCREQVAAAEEDLHQSKVMDAKTLREAEADVERKAAAVKALGQKEAAKLAGDFAPLPDNDAVAQSNQQAAAAVAQLEKNIGQQVQGGEAQLALAANKVVQDSYDLKNKEPNDLSAFVNFDTKYKLKSTTEDLTKVQEEFDKRKASGQMTKGEERFWKKQIELRRADQLKAKLAVLQAESDLVSTPEGREKLMKDTARRLADSFAHNTDQELSANPEKFAAYKEAREAYKANPNDAAAVQEFIVAASELRETAKAKVVLMVRQDFMVVDMADPVKKTQPEVKAPAEVTVSPETVQKMASSIGTGMESVLKQASGLLSNIAVSLTAASPEGTQLPERANDVNLNTNGPKQAVQVQTSK